MTPYNKVVLLVGGAAILASVTIGAIFVQTNAAESALQVDEAAVHEIQALGDELLLEVHEVQDGLDDYLLSGDPRTLARYRQAVADELRIAGEIRVGVGNLSGVANALAAIAAENETWQATVADPAIAAVQSGSRQALNTAIQAQITDQQTSQAASRDFVSQIDALTGDLHDRAIALSRLRVAVAAVGLGAELLAATLSLWFVRRYGLRIARDAGRRTRMSAERIEIIASLRTLRKQPTAEATAVAIAEALKRLPGIDAAGVFECTPDAIVALAIVGLPEFPIQTGDALPEGQARNLREQSRNGPWAQRWVRPAESSDYVERMVALGIKSWAIAPIRVEGELIGLIGVVTTDEDQARHMVEDLPAVGEFASVAEAILAPALVDRRQSAAGRRRIAAAIAAAAFRPVFQPIVELATGRTVGFEALTRFDDGSPPDLVFAAAVACGMGIDLELATLDATLREAGRLPAGTWLSMNVSPALLAKGGGTLAQMLAGRSGPVVLEITEHEAIDDYAPICETMVRLGPGVSLAVDDAGAGVANFSHLVELRPSYVKVDVSLVRGVDADPSRRAVVVGLIHFAAEAGCEVIAEGIETEAERATVTELGVTLGQGYLLARPASADTWSTAISKPDDTRRRIGEPRTRRLPVALL